MGTPKKRASGIAPQAIMQAKARTTPGPRGASIVREFQKLALLEVDRLVASQWPSAKYQRDPVGFVRDILGEKLLPHQISILRAAAESQRAKVAVRSGHKTGKALCLNTPVPTPDGWATMGSLREGDTVFGSNGAPVRVTYVSPVFRDRACYDVEFTDGSVITCDGSHEWETWGSSARRGIQRSGRGSPRVVTTSEIAATVDSAHRGREHAVAVAGALQTPPASLPIPPYTLGVWLGDGGAQTGYVYIAHRDTDILAHLAADGFSSRKMADERGCARYALTDAAGRSMRARLVAAGLLDNKRVPPEYLRAAAEQRLALLQGLLDTDGTCDKRGSIEFNNSNANLADGVFELAASLGLRPTQTKRAAKLNGRVVGVDHRVRFTAALPVFRTEFKRLRLPAAVATDTRYRTVRSVTPCPSVPVRCISVDSPDSLFLCGRAMIPTHNTKTVIWLALWFYCSFPEAQVTMTATTSSQVERVLWRELTLTIRRARAERGLNIEQPFANPASGLKSADGSRVIRGITVREKEAIAGLSGANQLFIGDEASAMPADIAEAIEGNTAGDARIVWISNPTRTEGPFCEAFHTKKEFWKLFHLSSERIAQECRAAGITIPGIATVETIEQWEREYGRDSPFFIVRALGDFVRNETGKIMSLDAITRAIEGHPDARDDGPLSIGIDPAGPGDGGDEFVFSIVRGAKLIALFPFRGLTEEGAIEHLRSFVATYRAGDEIPTAVIDSEGPIGSALYGRLRGISEQLKRHHPDRAYEVYGVKASMPARREPLLYERVREELLANLAKWLKSGGTIPQDYKLEAELHAPSWVGTLSGKLKATPKNELRDQLGRSPDRLDALALAVWNPMPWGETRDAAPVAADEDAISSILPANPGGELDPYSDNGFDPYGGR